MQRYAVVVRNNIGEVVGKCSVNMSLTSKQYGIIMELPVMKDLPVTREIEVDGKKKTVNRRFIFIHLRGEMNETAYFVELPEYLYEKYKLGEKLPITEYITLVPYE